MADNYDEDDLLNSSLTNLQWLQHINMNLNESLAVPRKTVASSSSSASSSPQSKVCEEVRIIGDNRVQTLRVQSIITDRSVSIHSFWRNQIYLLLIN